MIVSCNTVLRVTVTYKSQSVTIGNSLCYVTGLGHAVWGREERGLGCWVKRDWKGVGNGVLDKEGLDGRKG